MVSFEKLKVTKLARKTPNYLVTPCTAVQT